jgi:hypothetical protein
MAEKPTTPRGIKTVMDAHAAELMSIPGVTGVAVGLDREKTPCILVLVVRVTKEIRKRIPKEIEGHPVEMMVTGEIRGLSDRERS